MHLYPYSSNINKTVRKLHKIIQKRLPSIDGPRTLHILLDIVFPIDSMPLAKINICANEIFIKETDYANASLISSFLLFSQEKQFLKGILGRKSHCLMIKGKLVELLSLVEPLCEKSRQIKDVTYFYKKLHHRSLTGF